MDLELTLERLLSYEHLLSYSTKLKLNTLNRKMFSIPGLSVPKYVVDFESIILDNCVYHTVILCNYGPNATFIRLLEKEKRNKAQQKGKGRKKEQVNCDFC